MEGLRMAGREECFRQHITLTENAVFLTERTGCGASCACKTQTNQKIE